MEEFVDWLDINSFVEVAGQRMIRDLGTLMLPALRSNQDRAEHGTLERMKVIRRPDPPTGLRRALFRAPIRLYRWHLGVVLGGRFLLLEHLGRRSGKPRHVVLEVVNHDAVGDGYVVAAGFGPRTDWYRNLRAQPNAVIQVGRRRSHVVAEVLDSKAGAEFMVHYGSEHPKLGVRLARVMGFEVDGSAADFREAGREIRFVRLSPRR